MLQYHFFAGNYDVGLVSRTCAVLGTAGPCKDLDRHFDFMAASVDVLAVLIDVERLQHTEQNVRNTSMNLYSSIVQPYSSTLEQAKKAPRVVYEEHIRVSQNVILMHVAVAITTATTTGTINAAKYSLL